MINEGYTKKRRKEKTILKKNDPKMRSRRDDYDEDEDDE
jgi:hypothetical protein